MPFGRLVCLTTLDTLYLTCDNPFVRVGALLMVGCWARWGPGGGAGRGAGRVKRRRGLSGGGGGTMEIEQL